MDAPTQLSPSTSPIITADCWLPQLERAIAAAKNGDTIILDRPDLMGTNALSRSESDGKTINFTGPDGQPVTRRELNPVPHLDEDPGVKKGIQRIRIDCDNWVVKILEALNSTSGDLVLELDRSDLMLTDSHSLVSSSTSATKRRIYLIGVPALAN